MSQLLKFTDPNGGAIYYDVDDSLVISTALADPAGMNKVTKITSLDSGINFIVAEPIEQVCSMLEGTQRAK